MMKIYFKIADEDMDGGFLLLTPKGAGSVNGSGESCLNSFHIYENSKTTKSYKI